MEGGGINAFHTFCLCAKKIIHFAEIFFFEITFTFQNFESDLSIPSRPILSNLSEITVRNENKKCKKYH